MPNNFDIDGLAIFKNSTSNYGVLKEAIFKENAINYADGVIVNSAEFTQNSNNVGTVQGDATFRGTASNNGTVQGNATFTQNTANYGSVQGDAWFADGATNTGSVAGTIHPYTGPSPTPTNGPASTPTPTPSNSGSVAVSPTPTVTTSGAVLTPTPTPTVPNYFLNNVMLLNGDGSNYQTNSVILDEGVNNFTVTNNNTTQGSFSPHAPEGWSGYFNGYNSYIALPLQFNNNLVSLHTAKTTFECWIYPTAFTSDNGYRHAIFGNFLVQHISGRFHASVISNETLSSADIGFSWTVDTTLHTIQTNSQGVLKDRWNHIAITIDPTTPASSNVNIFINGAKSTFTDVDLSTQTFIYNIVNIGGNMHEVNAFAGYISNFKITKNENVYTNAFSPSYEKLTTTSQGTSASNVLLLTLQNGSLVDNSTYKHMLYAGGADAVVMQPLDPFAPSAEYSPTLHGGSGYFNGSTSVLTLPSSENLAFGTGPFTIELWVYPTAFTSQSTMLKLGSFADVWLMLEGAAIRVDFWPAGPFPAARIYSNITITKNTWNHIAVVRENTNENGVRLYLNGVLVGYSTLDTDFTSAEYNYVGSFDGSSYNYIGYMSNLRVVKGAAVYTSPFTPPSAPVGANANTALLLNFANGGIIDRTGKVLMNVTGDARISTAQFKYGTGSIYFDGVGDFITTPASELFKFGTGDFTVEWWWYVTADLINGNGPLIGQKLSDLHGGWFITRTSNSGINLRIAEQSGAWQVDIESTVLPTPNTWQHWAVVRSGNTITWYRDGIACGYVTDITTNIADSDAAALMCIGYSQADSYTILESYIDDLRITKGKARYTSNFTPPAVLPLK